MHWSLNQLETTSVEKINTSFVVVVGDATFGISDSDVLKKQPTNLKELFVDCASLLGISMDLSFCIDSIKKLSFTIQRFC